jgi:hypothetical protein
MVSRQVCEVNKTCAWTLFHHFFDICCMLFCCMYLSNSYSRMLCKEVCEVLIDIWYSITVKVILFFMVWLILWCMRMRHWRLLPSGMGHTMWSSRSVAMFQRSLLPPWSWEAAGSFESMVQLYQTMWWHIPDDSSVCSHGITVPGLNNNKKKWVQRKNAFPVIV